MLTFKLLKIDMSVKNIPVSPAGYKNIFHIVLHVNYIRVYRKIIIIIRVTIVMDNAN